MSDFLKKMYEEEMSKTGSAEFRSLMSALPKEDLESYLGLDKVGGISIPASFKNLGGAWGEAAKAAKAAQSAKPLGARLAHLSPKSMIESGRAAGLQARGRLPGFLKKSSAEQPADDERRKMKPNAPAKPEAKHQDEEPETNLDKKAARVRAIMDKLAVGGPAAPPLPDSEKGQLKVKQDKIHNDVNAGNPQKETVPVDHQGPGKEAVEVERDGKKITTTKEAMVWADNMGRSIVASMVKAAEDEASMELAQEKAKIAMMALRTSLHAPEQIKQASIKFAGMKLAALEG